MPHEFIVEVQKTDDGEGFIEIPEQIIDELSLRENDALSCTTLDDGSGFYLEKKL
ncbi:hypothetical protein [Vibrio sp. 10N.286.49.B3]|uniref:hypothetical protein n=1 Tax=Vibrio sp. 10N.286.49.B3 TaxID=1880855 RepID=UPI0012FFDA2E|nr:hypothetical protein [Vibrio sp. 10N.286.49.B3]